MMAIVPTNNKYFNLILNLYCNYLVNLPKYDEGRG
jgi:hypothetical protein